MSSINGLIHDGKHIGGCTLTTKQGIEIEKKFKVKNENLPARFAEYEHYKIRQGYFTRSGDSVEIRMRLEKHGDKESCYITRKRGSGIEREEVESPIKTGEYYEFMWGVNTIRKERFVIPHEGFVIEVDVYDYDPNKPFSEMNMVAEIELESADQLDGVELPKWIGEEVTGRPEYSNAMIAENGFPIEKAEEQKM